MSCDFPDWAGFTPESVSAELPRLLEAAERQVAALEAAAPDSFEDFVWRLDDATRELWQCWGRVGHLLGTMNSEAWRKIEETFQPRVVMFSLRVGQSRRLYELAKGVLAKAPAEGSGPLADTRRRILAKMVQSAELAGVGLEGARLERFNEIQQRLARLATDFQNAVIDATKAFSFEKDGKTYTIDDANYPETMKHCADREVRERLMRARSTRAPENGPRIDEILKLRQEEAELLGFADFAEKSLVTKCAPSRAAVLRMIDELDAATKAPAEAEERELGEGLEPWDLAYAAERLHRIVHDEHGGDALSVEGIALGKHGGRSRLNGGPGKAVPVHAFSRNGRKKISGLRFAVVGTCAAQHDGGGVQHLGTGGPCGLLQRHQHETSSLSIS